MKPSIERIFGTLVEVEEFYTCYTLLASFSVRKRTALLDKKRDLVGKHFPCSKQGLKEDRKTQSTYGLTKKGKEQKK